MRSESLKYLTLAASMAVFCAGTLLAPADAAKSAKSPAGAPAKRPMSTLLKEANALSVQKNYPAAVEKYKKACQAEPNNPDCYHFYGRTLAQMGLETDAIEQYRKALKLKPRDAELFNDLGCALYVNEDYKESARFLKRATEINEKYIGALNNLGASLQKLSDYKAAQEVFLRSLKLQPTNSVIQKRYAICKSKLGETKHFDFGSAVDAGSVPMTGPTENISTGDKTLPVTSSGGSQAPAHTENTVDEKPESNNEAASTSSGGGKSSATEVKPASKTQTAKSGTSKQAVKASTPKPANKPPVSTYTADHPPVSSGKTVAPIEGVSTSLDDGSSSSNSSSTSTSTTTTTNTTSSTSSSSTSTTSSGSDGASGSGSSQSSSTTTTSGGSAEPPKDQPQ